MADELIVSTSLTADRSAMCVVFGREVRVCALPSFEVRWKIELPEPALHACQLSEECVAVVMEDDPSKLVVWNAKDDMKEKEMVLTGDIMEMNMTKKGLLVLHKEGSVCLNVADAFRVVKRMTFACLEDAATLLSVSSKGTYVAPCAEGVQMNCTVVTGMLKSPCIRCVAVSPSGEYFAISDTDGHKVQVWSTSARTKKLDLWRGRTPCEMRAICFNKDDTLLAVHSDHGTCHVYPLSFSRGWIQLAKDKAIGEYNLMIRNLPCGRCTMWFDKDNPYRLNLLASNGDLHAFDLMVSYGKYSAINVRNISSPLSDSDSSVLVSESMLC